MKQLIVGTLLLASVYGIQAKDHFSKEERNSSFVVDKKGFTINKDEAEDTAKVRLKISGFVNAQMFFDTRQVVEGREFMLGLYPMPTRKDLEGNDFNGSPTFNALGMMSRLSFSVSGPRIWKADCRAVLEGDFTGQTNSDNNGFRLRHAFIESKWKYFGILFGQTWHPFNIIEAVPEVIGLNTGGPFRPFSRHPQLRISAYVRNFTIFASAAFQRDYTSIGPDGASPKYTRQGLMPTLDLQFQYKKKDFFIAIDGSVKRTLPRTVNPLNSGLKSSSAFLSYAATAAFSWMHPHVKLRAQTVWGQNLTEHIMLGGYAEVGRTKLSENADVQYANTSQISACLDVSSRFKHWNVGVFGGYAKNLKYPETEPIPSYTLKFYGRGENIHDMYRISPRLTYQYKALLSALETEFTAVNYAEIGREGYREVNDKVWNLRLLLSLTYYF